MNRIDFIAIHCSATPATATTVDVNTIRSWHRKQGWRDIGYHYVITRDGRIQKGRPDDQPGAHERQINRNSLAVCMVGGSPPIGSDAHRRGLGENNFTPAQWAALETLVKQLHAQHPRAEVIGHRDVPGVKKACPSFDARAWWASVTK